MKKYIIIYLILFLFSSLLSFGQFPVSGSFTGTTSALPIFVHGTSSTGVYLGHGGFSDVSNTAIGQGALITNSGAYNNTAIGNNALSLVTGVYGSTSGFNNTAVGVSSLLNTTSGSSNSSLGYLSMRYNTSGFFNSAMGFNSLGNNTSGFNNTAYGTNAGLGFTTSYNNIFVGMNSGSNGGSSLAGNSNIAVGVSALNSLSSTTNGDFNTALGYYALKNVTTGSKNVAIGFEAIPSTFTSISNSLSIQNTIYGMNMALGTAGVGIGKFPSYTTGSILGTAYSGIGVLCRLHVDGDIDHTIPSLQLDYVPGGTYSSSGASSKYLFVDAAGVVCQATLPTSSSANSWALLGNTGITDANYIGTSSANALVPFNILLSGNRAGRIDPNNQNSFYGYLAGNINGTSTTGIDNTSNGYQALATNASGNNNTAIGANALQLNTVQENTAVGAQSLAANTTGVHNTANGFNTLNANQTANDNTAVGYGALALNIEEGNTAVGSAALAASTTGWANTAVGWNAMQLNQSGYSNVAVGNSALTNNVGGIANTATGAFALYYNVGAPAGPDWVGSENTANGYLTLSNNTTGNKNTAVGCYAMEDNFTGDDNTTVGYYADVIGDGSYNTAIGAGALVGVSAPISNGTALGFNAHAVYDNSTAVGAWSITTLPNTVWLGDGTCDAWIGTGHMYQVSDQRFKTNINEDDVKGLEFIKLLRPVMYNFDMKKYKEFTTRDLPDSMRRKYFDKRDFSKSNAVRRSGLLAQEVEKAAKEVGYDFDGVHVPETKNDTYGVSYSEFVVPLVKAVQELSNQNDEQKKKIEDLEKEMEELKALITSKANEEGSLKITQESDAKLFQNAPNPFTKSTIIKYSIPASAKKAVLNITSISGVKIKEFDLKNKNGQSVEINAGELAAGTYIYSLIVDDSFIDAKQMILTH